MEEEEDSSNPKPLFPLSSPSPLPPPPSASTWLSNPSFTPNLPVPEPPLTFADDEPEPQPSPPPARPSYDLIPSSGEEEERKRRRRKRRRRDRERERERERDGRKSRVRTWEEADDRPEKEYYFDVKGDPDNLAFGSIYRADIARYKRHTLDFFGSGLRSVYRRSLNSLVEVDVDVLDDNLKTVGRYWSKRYSALERHKDFKHVKITSKNSARYGEEYICLDELQTSVDASLGEEDQESWEDEVIKKTREFNRKTRDFPHDEKVWMDFADFQDKLASMQPQKAARLQTLEKKISILEKAVELNPESEELLISLLKSYERRDSGDVLMGRWENALVRHFGSYKLWKEFLLVGQSEFSRFKVSEMRKRYAHAIRALSSAWSRMSRQTCWASKPEQIDSALVQLELGLVDIFVSLCRFEWQSGYQELATGLFQAQIEYCLLCPSLDLTSQSKLRLFEHFWNSNVPRVGEDDAIGWSTWIEKEEESRKKISAEDPTHEMDGGGWTGWFKPLSEKKETNEECMNDTEECNKDTEDFLASEDVNDSMEVLDAKPEDDTEELLKKLGITVDSEPHSEVQDTVTWNRWSKEESSRDLEQWMPIRENTDKTDEEQLSRTLLFEDVKDYLFPLCSEEARICLVSRFIDFFGGKVSQWTCTNSSWWMENNLSVDVIPRYILEHLKGGLGVANEVKNSNQLSFDILSDASNAGERTDINKFLRNSLFLCLTVFPRNFKLEEALLFAEELSMSQSDASSTQAMPSQSLAKRLLKNDRQNLLLSGLYAQREAAHGNLDRARRIFDMTLLLIDDMPLDVRENRALLCFWYAQMEVESSAPDRPPLRAIHVLSCLGTGEAYVPFSGQLPSLQLLKARNGYKEHIRYLGSSWAQGSISDQSVALVCAALLFEILTAGFTNATEVVEHAFSMTLPERRSYSLQLESLHVYYIKLLLRHINGMKLSQVWSRILKCLQVYPDNPDVLAAFIKVGSLCAVSQKIRLTIDEYCQRKSSIVVLLFALLFEFQKSCSRHRIRGLFERALIDDKLQKSAILWRCYLAFEIQAGHDSAAKRIFFRAIHACPWSKKLWLDGFQKLNSILSASELSDLHEVMRDKELNLRTDIYEILLQDEFET